MGSRRTYACTRYLVGVTLDDARSVSLQLWRVLADFDSIAGGISLVGAVGRYCKNLELWTANAWLLDWAMSRSDSESRPGASQASELTR